ncbi:MULTISPECIES: putative bifunctional diguanylate cyclase/phosphodiesterase [Pseudofrankia]|uniref:putative bifunctional diguanylate cyclase/phosphodiesterase n=1 Tax=Pseudofrankia TaxID=2994363 RepID=UPI001E636404|nr:MULTISPECIES: bifunctional diguanylate cyclase/phosphodiesterase [Pseudofrankia]
MGRPGKRPVDDLAAPAPVAAEPAAGAQPAAAAVAAARDVGAGMRDLAAAVQELAVGGDSPTTPMARRMPGVPPTPVGRALVSPVGANASGLVASGLAARFPVLPRTALAGWRRVVHRRGAGPRGGRPTAGLGAGDRQAAGAGTGPGVGTGAGGGGVTAFAVPSSRPVALASPVSPGPTGPLIALVVGLLVTVLVGLALLASRGAFGGGWTGRAGFLTSVLVATSLCLLTTRVKPVLRRFRGRDELTGLVGRRAFLDAATRVVGGGEHRVREAAPAALVLVDIDRFREINGVLGHESGDRLLAVVAHRLRVLIHPSDLAARIGGDEFAVLLRDAGPGRAELLASRLRDALRTPVLLADIPVQTEVSVGIAYAPAHGRSAAELLRHAEAAMYEAKLTRVGQRTYQRGRHAPTSPGRARLRLRAELRGALEQNQIELRYQPKADPRTGRVTGLEALVRWQHPREGLRGPAVFLPEMEQAGLMPQLTRRVLDLALADCASWHAAGAALSVSVNVPPSMIGDAGFVELVSDALRRHELAPRALVVEVTEEAVITAREQAGRTLADLRGLGVRVSLDDYGTGFCSLAYLRELPADEVKLDQMFLRDMHRDPSAAEIVRSTVSLAHALDLRIVAEGVETKAAWLALASWRCDEVQGYFISPPLAGGRVVAWLGDWAQRVSRQSQTAGASPSRDSQGSGQASAPAPGLAAAGQDDTREQPSAHARSEARIPPRGLAVAWATGLAVSPLVPVQSTTRNGQLGLPRPVPAMYAAPPPGRPAAGLAPRRPAPPGR